MPAQQKKNGYAGIIVVRELAEKNIRSKIVEKRLD